MPDILHQTKHTETRAYYMGNQVQTDNFHYVNDAYCCTIIMSNGTHWDNVPLSMLTFDVVEVE
jgi:hypothetical protein